MKHASLFSGIGGPEIAAAMMGWENLFHCEINPFGKAVLDYWFPESISYEDITKTYFKEWRGRVDVLTGGFPCQPFSTAGKRGGADDSRYLWPEMLRVINEVRPTWVIGENVAGIATMVESREGVCLGCENPLFAEDGAAAEIWEEESEFTIERICRDIESAGYSVQPMLIPAASVGAPHRRDRIFFLAHIDNSVSDGDSQHAGATSGTERTERVQERNEVRKSRKSSDVRPEGGGDAADTDCNGCAAQEENKGSQGSRSCADAVASKRSFAPEWADRLPGVLRNVSDTNREGLERPDESGASEGRQRMQIRRDFAGYPLQNLQPEERWKSFPTVSPIHRGNDGIPFDVDSLSLSFSKWREESLKAYGNAIVPQVMYEIFRAIEAAR